MSLYSCLRYRQLFFLLAFHYQCLHCYVIVEYLKYNFVGLLKIDMLYKAEYLFSKLASRVSAEVMVLVWISGNMSKDKIR